jgi:hypothetical protein
MALMFVLPYNCKPNLGTDGKGQFASSELVTRVWQL